MIRRPPRSTRTDTLFPYTTLFRSWTGAVDANIASKGGAREDDGYDATVDIPHIGGQLRGHALDGHAHAELKALASRTAQPVSSGEVPLCARNSRIDAQCRGVKVIALEPPPSPRTLAAMRTDEVLGGRGGVSAAKTRWATDTI